MSTSLLKSSIRMLASSQLDGRLAGAANATGRPRLIVLLRLAAYWSGLVSCAISADLVKADLVALESSSSNCASKSSTDTICLPSIVHCKGLLFVHEKMFYRAFSPMHRSWRHNLPGCRRVCLPCLFQFCA